MTRWPQALAAMVIVAGCTNSGVAVTPENGSPQASTTSSPSTSAPPAVTFGPDPTETTSTSLTTTTIPPPESTTTIATSTTTLPPIEEGRVAFVRYFYDPFYSEIYVMNPDGSDERRITDDGGQPAGRGGWCEMDDLYTASYAPRWSPDGRQLAFLHRTPDGVEARVFDVDGNNMQVLFEDWTADMFSWSPDGTRIAWGGGTPGLQREGLTTITEPAAVWIANADGTGARIVAHATRFEGATGEVKRILSVGWSHDGRYLAYIEHTGYGCAAGDRFITILDLETGETSSPPCGHNHPHVVEWAPDRTQLMTDGCYPGMAILAADGTVLREPVLAGAAPTWSPSGTAILSIGGDSSAGSGELWLYDTSSDMNYLIGESFSGGRDLQWQPSAIIR